MPPSVLRSVVSPARSFLVARSMAALSIAGLVPVACDTEPEDGLFGASAAGPSMPTSGAGTGGGVDDPDTDGATGDARADSGGDESTGGAAPPPATGSGPADSNGEPEPPPADTGGGTFDPLDDDGSSTSLGDDGGSASAGGGLPSSCCAAGLGAGCSDPAVEACVCGADAFCCEEQWDDLCAASADACGGNCGGGGGGGGGACCMVQAGPGCVDAAIEGCVCLFDSFCCDTQWDDVCVEEAADCGAPC